MAHPGGTQAVVMAWDVRSLGKRTGGSAARSDGERQGASQCAAANMTTKKLEKFRVRSETHPPTLQFEYRTVVYEATSARGGSATAWWDGILYVCQTAKDKESSFLRPRIWEVDGLQWSGVCLVRSNVQETLEDTNVIQHHV